jgi:MFS family permease
MSSASGLLILGAATLYGLGKAFFWPTSLGFVAEQFPRGGAVTLNLVAAVGMLAVGSVGSVTLGAIQDHATERSLVVHDAAHGTHWADDLLTAPRAGVFGEYRALDQARLAQADATTKADVVQLLSASKKEALRTVAFLPIVMLAVYLALTMYFRLRGGYRPQTVR